MSGAILPDPAEESPRRRYVAPPWARVQVEHVPTPLPLTRVVGVLDGPLALVLGRVAVYPTGLTFSLRLLPHPDGAEPDDELYGRFTGYGAARPDERLRVGLRLEDGRTATNRDIHGPSGPEPPEAAIVTVGAHGDGAVNESEHWAWPLPATGDLELVLAWPAKGLAETSIVLPGSALRDAAAAAAARPIWPGAGLPDPVFLER